MDHTIRIVAVRREAVDVDKLAAALLRLAREQAAMPAETKRPEPARRAS